MEKSFFSIFKIFFKIGMLLLGGGYVILPLLKSELVDKKNWITSEELSEYFALSSSLPGIIAANVSIFTGRKLLGTKGAIAAITGVTLPAFISIILLASIFGEIVHFVTIQHIFWGIGIGVITLLFLAIREMWSKCIVDKFSVFIFIICLVLALIKISPSLIIFSALCAGLLRQKIKNERIKNNA